MHLNNGSYCYRSYVSAAIADNARNICLALENLDVEHIGCLLAPLISVGCPEDNVLARDVKGYR